MYSKQGTSSPPHTYGLILQKQVSSLGSRNISMISPQQLPWFEELVWKCKAVTNHDTALYFNSTCFVVSPAKMHVAATRPMYNDENVSMAWVGVTKFPAIRSSSSSSSSGCCTLRAWHCPVPPPAQGSTELKHSTICSLNVFVSTVMFNYRLTLITALA